MDVVLLGNAGDVQLLSSFFFSHEDPKLLFCKKETDMHSHYKEKKMQKIHGQKNGERTKSNLQQLAIFCNNFNDTIVKGSIHPLLT